MLIEAPGLTVLGAPLDQVFLMKLFASRAADVDDMAVLWERCSFDTPEAAAEAFHLAYPHLEVDEFLADHSVASSERGLARHPGGRGWSSCRSPRGPSIGAEGGETEVDPKR